MVQWTSAQTKAYNPGFLAAAVSERRHPGRRGSLKRFSGLTQAGPVLHERHRSHKGDHLRPPENGEYFHEIDVPVYLKMGMWLNPNITFQLRCLDVGSVWGVPYEAFGVVGLIYLFSDAARGSCGRKKRSISTSIRSKRVWSHPQ